MTNEEMQNTIQFILDHEAHLTAKLDELSDNVEQLTDNVDKLAGNVDKLAVNLDKLVESQMAHEKRTTRLEESFQLLVQLAGNVDGRIDALTEAQSRTGAQLAATDNRLNALIETVERYISEGRNGYPKE